MLGSLRHPLLKPAHLLGMCREYQRYGSFLGLNNEAKNVAEAQAQLKARGDFTGKLSDQDIEAARKEGAPVDGYAPGISSVW